MADGQDACSRLVLHDAVDSPSGYNLNEDWSASMEMEMFSDARLDIEGYLQMTTQTGSIIGTLHALRASVWWECHGTLRTRREWRDDIQRLAGVKENILRAVGQTADHSRTWVN